MYICCNDTACFTYLVNYLAFLSAQKTQSTNEQKLNSIFKYLLFFSQMQFNKLYHLFQRLQQTLGLHLLLKKERTATSFGSKATTCAAKGNIIISYSQDGFGSGGHVYCLVLQKRRLLLRIWQMSLTCLCGTFNFNS